MNVAIGQIDMHLRQIFLHKAHELIGECSCISFVDFGQLPVMDLALYSKNELSNLRSTVLLATLWILLWF